MIPRMSEEAHVPRLRGRDIVCVGFADWDTDLWTNQQHLMSRLARENRVLFVESLGLRQPQLAGRDVKRILRRLRRGIAPPRPADGLHVLSPLVIPLHRFAAVRALNRRLLPWLVRRAARRLGLSRPILWAYVPQAEALLDALDPSLVVYHCVDDIAAQPGIDAASFRAAEGRFARRAELVLASAPSLAARMRTLNDNVLDAPNVADTALFARALQDGPVDAGLDALPRPRVVFTGAVVATKLDVPLLVELARARPDWSFALVGPGRARRPAHRRLGARCGAERPPARRARLRRAARRAARRRRGPDPVCAQRADGRDLPDEGLRVPRGRPAGRRDAAAGDRRRGGGCDGHGCGRPRGAARPRASPATSRHVAPSARTLRRRTRGTRGWRRSRSRSRRSHERSGARRARLRSHARCCARAARCARTASRGRSRRPGGS